MRREAQEPTETTAHSPKDAPAMADEFFEYRLRIANRGNRPRTRGWSHLFAAYIAGIFGTSLTTLAFVWLPWWQAVGVGVYGLGLVGLFGISAAYHRGRWRSPRTVQWWRRADHASIALFIASTYTPLCLSALSPTTAAWMLCIAWSGAIGAAVLNLIWITHPRILDVVVYLALGWLIVPLIPQLWSSTGAVVVWLLFAGGVVYSLGAIIYGTKWPGRNARFYGYHEHFHTATIVAAALHAVAVALVVGSG